MYKNKKRIMEWDGVILCDNEVFLLESKYKMTKVGIKKISFMNSCRLLITWLTYKSCIQEHIENLVKRLNEFPNKLEAIDSAKFKKLVGKEFIGVACGSSFPLELRQKSMEEGLMVVFPGGNRYKVEAPQELNQPMQLCCDIC